MLTTLVLVLLTSAPREPTRPGAQALGECEDVQRVELSPSTAVTPPICVSPGLMTGLLFDHPAVVELEDEERFVAVTRGRNGASFVPPGDMRPGEQLRLMASLQIGEVRQSLTFMLVAHAGQATRQVEVYHDPRTWQSLHDELGQAWLTNQRLGVENEALRAGLEQARMRLELTEGLRGAYLEGQLGNSGVSVRTLGAPANTQPTALTVVGAISFLSHKSVAVEVKILNKTHKPWLVTRSLLINELGKTWEAVRFWPSKPLVPDELQTVFMEFGDTSIASERVTLVLEEEGFQGITIPGIVFPKL